MSCLEDYLCREGYDAVSFTIPTTLNSLEECSAKLHQHIDTLDLPLKTMVHFVGHSMGGLVIRYYLAHRKICNIGRCVLIATPNQGTYLADIASKLLRYSPMNPFKSIKSLQTSAVGIQNSRNFPPSEIGVIAGNNSNLFLGKMLRTRNDGRVEVYATKFDGMKDFVVLPFGHNEIHHQKETAKLVDIFLRSGVFDVETLDNSFNDLSQSVR